MAAIKAFDKSNLKAVRADLNAALATVAAKHGITLNVGNITFRADSFSTKLTAITNNATAGAPALGNVKWTADFLKNGMRFGFAKADLGKTFNYYGEEVTIVGLRSKARQPVVLAKKNGTYIAAGSEFVRSALKATV